MSVRIRTQNQLFVYCILYGAGIAICVILVWIFGKKNQRSIWIIGGTVSTKTVPFFEFVGCRF